MSQEAWLWHVSLWLWLGKQGKKRDMEAKASKHAGKRVHECARARARARVPVRV